MSQADELRRLKAELKRVTEERDILKKAALDSTRRCNTFDTRVQRGRIHGEIGTSRTVGCAAARVVGALEGRGFHQRHRSCIVQAPWVGAWGARARRRHLQPSAQTGSLSLDDTRARADFARPGGRSFMQADRRGTWPIQRSAERSSAMAVPSDIVQHRPMSGPGSRRADLSPVPWRSILSWPGFCGSEAGAAVVSSANRWMAATS